MDGDLANLLIRDYTKQFKGDKPEDFRTITPQFVIYIDEFKELFKKGLKHGTTCQLKCVKGPYAAYFVFSSDSNDACIFIIVNTITHNDRLLRQEETVDTIYSLFESDLKKKTNRGI